MEIKEYQRMYEFEDEYWWFVGRKNNIDKYINSINITKESSILDAGCGTGINMIHLSKYSNDIIGIDTSDEAIYFCMQRGLENVIKRDVEDLNLKHNSFDLITALDILEHIDDTKALSEFYKVLKPKGYLIINVPAFNFLWSKHDEALHHKRRYTKSYLKKKLMSEGFTIENISYWNTFLFLPMMLFRFFRKYFSNSSETDLKVLPKVINKCLIIILKIESTLIGKINLPFGVSLLCLAKVDK